MQKLNLNNTFCSMYSNYKQNNQMGAFDTFVKVNQSWTK